MNSIHSEKTSGHVKKSKDIAGVLMRPRSQYTLKRLLEMLKSQKT